MNFRESKLLLVLLVAVVLASACPPKSDDQGEPEFAARKTEDRGRQILAEYLKRDAAPYRKTKVRITVVDSEDAQKSYVLESWRRQSGGEARTFTRALEPPDQTDLASLTIEPENKPTVNVSYIGSQKRFRETGTNKFFFGGLTSQELLGEWDMYYCSFLNEKNVDGKKMFEVECKIKKNEKSVITRIAALFDSQTYLPFELLLFNSNDKHLRTFRVNETKSVDDRVVVSNTEIENHIQRSKTTVKLLNISFPDKIPDEAFEREYLKQFAK